MIIQGIQANQQPDEKANMWRRDLDSIASNPSRSLMLTSISDKDVHCSSLFDILCVLGICHAGPRKKVLWQSRAWRCRLPMLRLPDSRSRQLQRPSRGCTKMGRRSRPNGRTAWRLLSGESAMQPARFVKTSTLYSTCHASAPAICSCSYYLT